MQTILRSLVPRLKIVVKSDNGVLPQTLANLLSLPIYFQPTRHNVYTGRLISGPQQIPFATREFLQGFARWNPNPAKPQLDAEEISSSVNLANNLHSWLLHPAPNSCKVIIHILYPYSVRNNSAFLLQCESLDTSSYWEKHAQDLEPACILSRIQDGTCTACVIGLMFINEHIILNTCPATATLSTRAHTHTLCWGQRTALTALPNVIQGKNDESPYSMCY